jgi:hypothetical protein
MAKDPVIHSLTKIPAFDRKGAVTVVIETPRGSRNKYDYNPDYDCLELGKVLPEGMVFPYDFGFVPSTLADDGDPLDVLALLDAPVVPGCVVRTRPIGVIEAEQKAKGENWIRNDRLLMVAVMGRLTGDSLEGAAWPAAGGRTEPSPPPCFMSGASPGTIAGYSPSNPRGSVNPAGVRPGGVFVFQALELTVTGLSSPRLFTQAPPDKGRAD